MSTYKLLPFNDPALLEYKPEYEDYYDEWEDDYVAVRVERGKVVEVLGSDGGEPEDNSFVRDWSWVVPALNEAYQRGYGRGRSDGPRDALDMG